MSIEGYLNTSKSKSFNTLLFEFIDKRGYKDSEVYNNVYIDRRLFSKIRCNKNYIPKKETIIKLCISLRLNLDDTNKLLKSAGYTLSYSNDFDLIIIFCLENSIYDINIIESYLYKYTKTTIVNYGGF